MAKKQRKHGKQENSPRLRRELVRVTEYMISGGVYFWTGYLIFFLCDKGLHWNLWWAKLAANIIGWTVNYLLQRFWVFNNPRLTKHRLEVTRRYLVLTLVDFLLDYLIVLGLKDIGVTPYLGQFASAGFFTVWNYLWYRFWVFTNRIHHHTHHRPTHRRKFA